jgi:cobalamin biosynthesis protein CobD/CbiB
VQVILNQFLAIGMDSFQQKEFNSWAKKASYMAIGSIFVWFLAASSIYSWINSSTTMTVILGWIGLLVVTASCLGIHMFTNFLEHVVRTQEREISYRDDLIDELHSKIRSITFDQVANK